MNISEPLEPERDPGNHPHGDEVDAHDEHRERIIEKLVGELDADIQRPSPKEGPENENISHQEGPQIDDICRPVSTLLKRIT